MADESPQGPSQHRGTAEFPGGVPAHEQIHAPEHGTARQTQDLEKAMARQLGIQTPDNVQDSGKEPAADEPGDQGYKDPGDPFQKQFSRGGIPGPDGLMELFSVPHFSGKRPEIRFLCVRLSRFRPVRSFLEQGLEGLGHLGCLSRPQDDLELRSGLVDPHDPGQFLQSVPVHILAVQLEPEPGHAVAGLAYVFPGPHDPEDFPGQLLIFHGPPPIPLPPSGHCPGSGPGSAGLLPGCSR